MLLIGGKAMVETIRPRGAISESLVVSVYEKEGKFYLIDEVGNRMRIPEYEFNRLLSEGVLLNENFIKNS